ncbi:hypothetical protein PPTG_21468 [Phytophthora nicotianae INRA-310]|uniref:DUF4939 domain-containing protein n=1 Tax=Phytophthora nicotianae (strain INRA-310) TaxID=761204 RepID=W2R242_PHYN3|nr:hypothetical protein PPTG_21468 [Phytophthora nicotianae INRA-310]ETN19512.1 hypothetical protein PPTG_21468 [Phytophthora nicotianae INRA-310]
MKPHGSTERRVEGISVPTYYGKIGESLQVFLQQVQLYFCAKNIEVNAAENQNRLVVMVATNVIGQAAAWYTFHQGNISA